MNRYRYTSVDRNPFRFYRTTQYPYPEKRDDDIWVITQIGDRLDLLANQFYQDVSLWWIIAIANNLGTGSLVLEPGIQLRIPIKIDSILSDLQQIQGN